MQRAESPDQLKRMCETLSDWPTDHSVLGEQRMHASVESLLQGVGA
jgi:hypothetical protein